MIEGIDILAELFGAQKLLLHLLDDPKTIHRLLDQLDSIYFEIYDSLAPIIRQPDGSVPYMWLNAWSPGQCAKIQCDFSAMISPDMFQEFVRPHLRRQCQKLDYTIYHLDGPDAVRHLDTILKIPAHPQNLWVDFGSGSPPIV